MRKERHIVLVVVEVSLLLCLSVSDYTRDINVGSQAGPSRVAAIAPVEPVSVRTAPTSWQGGQGVGSCSSDAAISLEAISAAEALEDLGTALPEPFTMQANHSVDDGTSWQGQQLSSEDEEEREGQPTRTTLIVEPNGQSTFFGTDAGLAWLRVVCDHKN
jgi:hypothetical protein